MMIQTENDVLLRPLVPGSNLAGDWYPGTVPLNIVAGAETVIDSSFCFKHFFSRNPEALVVGKSVTLWRTALSTEENGCIEIGDYCYLANASLVCSEKITIGSGVFIGGGATIADSDFHPLSAAGRLADTIALSPGGDNKNRPKIKSKPVTIGNDVWIGYNATILKGVHIGNGAVISPGAVVVTDVPSGTTVAGNPAKPISVL